MGIVNLTPDSFHEPSRKTSDLLIYGQVEQMLRDGADFIDLGAVSTRPGSDFVSEGEEKRRLFSILPELCVRFPETAFSIDTYRSGIALEAAQAGAAIINDVSGGSLDADMFITMSRLQIPYVLMHMRGTPQTMGQFTHYNHFPEDVIFELAQRVDSLRKKGVADLIIDPGFGFAKTVSQNLRLLKSLKQLSVFDAPILVGLSRKKTIQHTLSVEASEALNGTTYLHAIALENGADILRVHDVREAVECVKLHLALKNA